MVAHENLLTTSSRHWDPSNEGYQRPPTKGQPFFSSPQPTWTPTTCWYGPDKCLGWLMLQPPPPSSATGNPTTRADLQVTQATQHRNIALPNKLEGRLARLLQLARMDPLCTQGMGDFMEAVLKAAAGYQALQLPNPKDALHHACRQVTRAWVQHGGWPISFHKEATKASWCYHGDDTGALDDESYARHAAHPLHRMTHNGMSAKQQPYASRKRKQPATPVLNGYSHNTALPPLWALASGPSCRACCNTTHTIVTKQHCDQPGSLVATHTDIHRHPAGKVNILRAVGATITVVCITPTPMNVIPKRLAHHARFLVDPQWPTQHAFRA